MTFKQFESVASCISSFMLAQKRRPRISEFRPKFTFLLEQQIKFILSLTYPSFSLTVSPGEGGIPMLGYRCNFFWPEFRAGPRFWGSNFEQAQDRYLWGRF